MREEKKMVRLSSLTLNTGGASLSSNGDEKNIRKMTEIMKKRENVR